MLVPIQTITYNSNGSWTFTWNVTTGSYRIVLQGVQLALVTAATYTWNQPGFVAYPPPIEVADTADLVLSEQFLPYMTLQWYGNPECVQYLIQQYNGTSWSTVSTAQEVGSWVYTYQTQLLADESTYDYQIIALDAYGNQSPPMQFQRYVICPPLFPDTDVVIGYNQGTTSITVGAN